MQKYGKMENGNLLVSTTKLSGYKPIEYATIPEFDETQYYAKQGMVIEYEDRISIGVDIIKVEVVDVSVEAETPTEFVPSPPWKEERPVDKEVKTINAQLKATNEYMDFLEEVIVEMAEKVY